MMKKLHKVAIYCSFIHEITPLRLKLGINEICFKRDTIKLHVKYDYETICNFQIKYIPKN